MQRGISKKEQIQFFDSFLMHFHAFSCNLNAMNSKFFHGGIYRFERKLNKYSKGRDKALRVCRNMGKCIIEVNPKGLG